MVHGLCFNMFNSGIDRVPTEVACQPRAGAASFGQGLPVIILIRDQSEHHTRIQNEASTPALRFHSCCAVQRLLRLRFRHCKSFVLVLVLVNVMCMFSCVDVTS